MKNTIIFSLLISSILLFGSCTPKLVSTPNSNEPVDDVVISELLVKLKENVSPQTLESDFSEYDLRLNSLKSKQEKAENTYIFGFNSKKIGMSEMLIKIVEHPGVKEANFVEVTEFE